MSRARTTRHYPDKRTEMSILDAAKIAVSAHSAIRAATPASLTAYIAARAQLAAAIATR